jgi:hypothetical protein
MNLTDPPKKRGRPRKIIDPSTKVSSLKPLSVLADEDLERHILEIEKFSPSGSGAANSASIDTDFDDLSDEQKSKIEELVKKGKSVLYIAREISGDIALGPRSMFVQVVKQYLISKELPVFSRESASDRISLDDNQIAFLMSDAISNEMTALDIAR